MEAQRAENDLVLGLLSCHRIVLQQSPYGPSSFAERRKESTQLRPPIDIQPPWLPPVRPFGPPPQAPQGISPPASEDRSQGRRANWPDAPERASPLVNQEGARPPVVGIFQGNDLNLNSEYQ